jgi:hypothetical protein
VHLQLIHTCHWLAGARGARHSLSQHPSSHWCRWPPLADLGASYHLPVSASKITKAQKRRSFCSMESMVVMASCSKARCVLSSACEQQTNVLQHGLPAYEEPGVIWR